MYPAGHFISTEHTEFVPLPLIVFRLFLDNFFMIKYLINIPNIIIFLYLKN